MLKFTAVLLLSAVLNANAGSLANGGWTPANCGAEPPPPTLDESSVTAFNASLKTVKDWQQRAQAYNHCVVNEANADNEAIAQAANAQQERYRAAAADISAAAAKAKAKLDGK